VKIKDKVVIVELIAMIRFLWLKDINYYAKPKKRIKVSEMHESFFDKVMPLIYDRLNYDAKTLESFKTRQKILEHSHQNKLEHLSKSWNKHFANKRK
jgi:hypothetical protein